MTTAGSYFVEAMILGILTLCFQRWDIQKDDRPTDHTTFKPKTMPDTSCFSPENFQKVKAYIEERILFSGAGKFYLEYPPDPQAKKDGIKRPSAHPENVYQVTYETASDQIRLQSPQKTFIFQANKGLILPDTLPEKSLAEEIFCDLLEKSR